LPPPVIAPSAAKTSTAMSKVPSRPVSLAVMPLPPCAPPKARLATSTPMATVSTSLPSLNWVLARPTDGPCSDSGPRLMVLEAAPAVATAVMVKTSSLRAEATTPSPLPARQLPATTCTPTSPTTKVSLGSMPVRVVRR